MGGAKAPQNSPMVGGGRAPRSTAGKRPSNERGAPERPEASPGEGNNKIPITRAMCTGTETTALQVNILITVRRLTGSRQKRRHELRHLRREPERLDRPTAQKARRAVGALGQLRHVGERLLGLRRRPRLEPQPRPQPVRPLLGLVDLGALGRRAPLLRRFLLNRVDGVKGTSSSRIPCGNRGDGVLVG